MVDAPAIYARHFTAAELRELVEFYHSPVGAKALHELPQIAAESIGLIMPKMPQLQAQVMSAFSAVLKKKGIDL
ncbi:MAG TPA: DUF2059 domain-containing protein [Pseudolabrys sp.]|nr:DUF2059 domain-containing protein [Pseudolabrys sp.]